MPLQQLALDIGLAPEPSFSRFHPGANAEALTFLEQMACTLGAQPPVSPLPLPETAAMAPTYLWGEAGTGKTHLLKAIALSLKAQGLQFGWMDAQAGNEAAFPAGEFEERWSALLLDDVHLYDAARQEAAFNWFVNASHPASGAPRWVVAAGKVPVTDLQIREDLRTRLGWGPSWQLRPLDDEARQNVLQQQARERGLHLGDEVARYLLTHFARDLNSLTALLARLDAYALRTRRSITVPMLKNMLHDEHE